MRLTHFILLVFILVSACAPVPNLFGPTPLPPTPRPPTRTPGPTPIPTSTIIPTDAPANAAQTSATSTTVTVASAPASLWIGPTVPDALAAQVRTAGVNITQDAAASNAKLDVSDAGGAEWIYALVAPFPTTTDDVSSADLRASWKGDPAGPFAGLPLRMAESTRAAFSALWGEPAPGSVTTESADQLLDSAWNNRPAWAIIPFEEIQPKWKVLNVDGQSPLRKDFDASAYPLKVSFDFQPSSLPPSAFRLPPSNRDPSKLTTVIMTGVTALVRLTAVTMNVKGVLYPGENIRDVLRQADITHISNEIPFYGGCPDPDPNSQKLVFCSPPRYMSLLTDVGTDVVELTGNHFADYGPGAMQQTLALYQQNNIPYFGGGSDVYDARKPLLMENNGNKFAFIGCNYPDRGKFPTASETRPGAAPCDYNYETDQIRKLSADGYLVIATFQYTETDQQKPFPLQVNDFRMMADAGAVIVHGSQAHTPQTMEFYKNSFIHYGLGNLFFDQMGGNGVDSIKRREFVDRHVFYDGRYLGVELLTYILEDYSRPVPMTADERTQLLTEYFHLSGW